MYSLRYFLGGKSLQVLLLLSITILLEGSIASILPEDFVVLVLATLASAIPLAVFLDLLQTSERRYSLIVKSVAFYFYTWLFITILEFSVLWRLMAPFTVFVVWATEGFVWLLLQIVASAIGLAIERIWNKAELRALADPIISGFILVTVYLVLNQLLLFLSDPRIAGLEWYYSLGILVSVLAIVKFLWSIYKRSISNDSTPSDISDIDPSPNHDAYPASQETDTRKHIDERIAKRIIEYLKLKSGRSFGEIARAIGISQHTASEYCKELRRRDVLRIDDSARPHRRVYLIDHQED